MRSVLDRHGVKGVVRRGAYSLVPQARAQHFASACTRSHGAGCSTLQSDWSTGPKRKIPRRLCASNKGGHD
jgi:hypothetical protein